jgi:hypothetical protein
MHLKAIHEKYDWIVVPMLASVTALVLSFGIWMVQGAVQ